VIETDLSVLIQGESGTGKELIAKAVHKNSHRKDKPFISENCGAVPETLLESELFGYEKGAFTGAQKTKEGLFELADGGTIFLDEVGNMSSGMQKRLLRVLQEGEIRRVGGKGVRKVDVRVVAASNADLREMVRNNLFREDLYYRLNVITVNLPPLRKRKSDVPVLAGHFLKLAAKRLGRENGNFSITDNAIEVMKKYPWPGNVRELENTIYRTVALSGDTITVESLGEKFASYVTKLKKVKGDPRSPLADILADTERREIKRALSEAKKDTGKAAEILGISINSLEDRMQALGLNV
ncbi:MAG: sigma-54 interaction domain-containing protein, partial [Planctomycetota bacterium]